MPDLDFKIEPVQGERHKERQWGWMLFKSVDGGDWEAYLHCTWGGTGPCWNLADGDDFAGLGPIHICELEELQAAIEFLRLSEANAANVRQWK